MMPRLLQRMRLLGKLAAVSLALALLHLAGCATHDNAPPAPTETLATGRKIYVAKCGKCHKLYAPATYSDEEWAKWMRKMSKKAKLSAEKEVLVSGYIEEVIRSPARKHIGPN
jgi:mono/diheme cytochrome c family protein